LKPGSVAPLRNDAISWFATALGQLDGSEYDAEVLAVATLLRDLGLAKTFEGPLRFEVERANAARDFARKQGLEARRAQLIWDGVALKRSRSQSRPSRNQARQDCPTEIADAVATVVFN